MNQREKALALVIALFVGGWLLWSFVVSPVSAAFDAVDQEAEEVQADLDMARTFVDSEAKIRKRWVGYQRAGLARTLEEADAQTGRALFTWAEDAGFARLNLSDGKTRTDAEKPFGELSYTLQTTGKMSQVYELLWAVREAPFPLRVEKCVIDLKSGDEDQLDLSLSVSTLFTPEPTSR